MHHVARILASPLKGVYSTHIDSAQQFDRHWHDTYGFGFLEHGAQEWFSGRGIVRGYPGEVITTNPGELHDGRPLGPPTRRWRILYVDVDVMRTLTASERGRAEITSPVIKDAMLFRILQGLFARLERWNSRTPHAQPVDSLAFEEALVASCVRLMARHGTTRWSDAPPRRACADFNSGRLYSRGGSGGDRFRRPESHDARVCAAVRLHARRVASGSTVAITCKTPAPCRPSFSWCVHPWVRRARERAPAGAGCLGRAPPPWRYQVSAR